MNAIASPTAPSVLPKANSPNHPAIRVDIDADGIAVVCFDRPGSSVNILDTKTLHALSGLLAELESARGVVFTSAKPAVFLAGADLKELAAAQNREALVDLGQETFSRIAALRCVTVAAIHGACAGGGLELALACDYRVASRDRKTRIGLPEVNLGLLPAWGGSTRLPRLVGLRRAFQIILGGELMPPAKARKLGLVDALAPRERLLDLARRFAAKDKSSPHCHLPWIPAAPVVAGLARRSVLRKTRGHYPAPLAAIDVISASLVRTVPASLAREKTAILALAETEACRNLLQLFVLQDHAKHFPAPRAKPVRKTAVIGAGVMGAGIAQWFAARGCDVLLRDVSAEPLARGLQRAAKLFSEARRRGLMSATEVQAGMDRLVPVDVPVSLKSIDLIVEAAVEKMDLKKQIFAGLEERTGPETVLATNTSALSATEIARSLRHPRRMVGMHFFNPVHRMKLVEVVRTDMSSDEAVDTAVAFVQRIGKLPVVVRDRPGFLVNRILLPYLLEAARLFEQGVDIRTIDESMLEFGMPMGPMRLLDEIGLDVAADVAQTLCAAFPDRLRMPDFHHLIKQGFAGRKTGRGFYLYRGGHAIGVNPMLAKPRRSPAETGDFAKRMVSLMIEEAARCLDEHVVEDPADIDFAMIMGTGFAPFRGGPLRYADSAGLGPQGRKFYET